MKDRERRAVAAVFTVHGAVSGTFASRLPWISDRLHLSSGKLGSALLMGAIGALVTMPFAGRFVHRFGTGPATRILTVLFVATLAAIAWTPNVYLLGLGMCFLGAMGGTADMGMNSQGIVVEKRLGTSIMSSLHGMWSVGVLTAAFAGSLAAHAHIDARVHFAAVAVVLATAGVIATTFFTSNSATAGGAGEAGKTGSTEKTDEVPRFVLPRGPILLIGLVGFCAIFAEIGANDWSAVYLHRTLKSSEALAAAGTGMFALTMATGRLSGDHIVRRIGAGTTVRICGLLGATGGALVVVAQTAVPAIIGFMLIGAGVSVVVPLAFAAAGHASPNPTLGVAGVATISYGAGLAAPGIIGGVADITSLRVAFTVVAILAGTVAAGAGLLDRQPSREESATATKTAASPATIEN